MMARLVTTNSRIRLPIPIRFYQVGCGGAGSGATIPVVSVFKRLPGTHMHIRTPIMVGLIVLLFVVLSAFCYYHTVAPGETLRLPVADLRTPDLWNARLSP